MAATGDFEREEDRAAGSSFTVGGAWRERRGANVRILMVLELWQRTFQIRVESDGFP